MTNLSLFRYKNNRRFQSTQRVANYFPEEMRLREVEYSVGQQLINELTPLMEEQNLNVTRALHNYLPQTFDSKEIDLIYSIPNILGTNTTFKGFWGTGTGDFVYLEKIEDGALDEFWYSPLPNRLEPFETSVARRPIRRAATDIYKSSIDFYLKESLVENLIETETGSFDYVNCIVSLSTNTANDISKYKVTNNAAGSSIEISQTSTVLMTGKEIKFYGKFSEETSLNPDSIIYEVGYLGGGETSQTSTERLQERSFNLNYLPESTETGYPFFRVSFTNSTSTLGGSGSVSFEPESINLINNQFISEDSTSCPWIDFLEDDIQGWVWVKASNGTSLLSPNSKDPQSPASIAIKGIGLVDEIIEENIAIPFNGYHRGNRIWKKISEIKPQNFSPNLEFEVSLRNYQSTDSLLNPLQLYIDKKITSPLFYGVESTNGTSFLDWKIFESNDIDNITPEYITEKSFELLDESTASVEIRDFTLDYIQQVIYALGTDSKLYLYDAFDHQPSQEALNFLQEKRSANPSMKIFTENSGRLKKGGEFFIEGDWIRKDKIMQKWRIFVRKPDGTIKSLNLSGVESDFVSTPNWNIYDEYRSTLQNKDSLFKRLRIPFELDQRGDYVVCFEAVFVNPDDASLISEVDCAIFQVKSKTPLEAFSLPSGFNLAQGIDLDPDGNLCFCFDRVDTNLLWNEIKLKRRYDYFLKNIDAQSLFLREGYTKIVIEFSNEESGEMCKKTVTISDGNLTIDVNDLNCGLFFIKSTGAARNVYLPPITADIDGEGIVICRWGSNSVTVNPDGSDTIDGGASLVLLSDKDSYTLVPIHSESLWKII